MKPLEVAYIFTDFTSPLYVVLCVIMCHTRFSEENQVFDYMYARIKFHTYSDIIVNNKNNIT
jgi:hypothetical protein